VAAARGGERREREREREREGKLGSLKCCGSYDDVCAARPDSSIVSGCGGVWWIGGMRQRRELGAVGFSVRSGRSIL
jgi:hypothetical protein